MTIGVSTLAFTSAEKIVNVYNRNVSPYKKLDEVTVDELEDQMPFAASDTPTQYALKQLAGDSVTILVNCVPQTAFALYADVYSTTATLSGADKPVFSESYHDILISAVLIDEYLKLDKPGLSKVEHLRVYGDGHTTYGRMGELRHWIAVSTTKEQYQNKTESSGAFSGGASGSGSSVNGALSYTQTGNIHFDRSGAGAGTDPFTVVAGSGKVDNLDADKLDGLDSTAFRLASGSIVETDLSFTDIATANVTSTKHGLAPKSPADAAMFLNGAATPAFAAVKDSDLATTDVATNNAATTKHGFLKKLSNVATEFMTGTGVWAAVKDSDLSTSDITTNDFTTAKHGFVPKGSADTGKFLRADGGFAMAFPQLTQGRLTLTSGTPVTTADVTGATSIFFSPYGGNRIALYDGTNWILLSFSEITQALGTITSGLPYDVFAYINAGAVATEILAWTNDTTRATALALQDGVLVKSGTTTRKYLGTFRTTSTTTTEDSLVKRFVWNYYNRKPRIMRAFDTADTWAYSLSTIRQSNANAANQLDFVLGVAEEPANVCCRSTAASTSGADNFSTGIGYDSTTVMQNTGQLMGRIFVQAANQKVANYASLVHYPAVGRHIYTWLERSGTIGTITWDGDAGAPTVDQNGIQGIING
jgi:hypothetical protein